MGGGPILEALIGGLGPNSWARIYGALEAKPLQIKVALNLNNNIFITGYLLFTWFSQLSAEEKQKIKAEYSTLLKGDLKTHSYKHLPYS